MMRSYTGALAAFATAGLLTTMLTAGLPIAAAAQQSPQATMPPAMGSTQTVPDATVQKAGVALRHVAQIQQDYTQRIKSAPTQDQQRQLTQQADAASVQAINEQGLSVDQYNQVIRMAQADPTMKERLLTAARKAP